MRQENVVQIVTKGSKLTRRAHSPFKKAYLSKRPKKPVKAKSSRTKKSEKKKAIWAEFGLKPPVYIRYSGYGGVLWYVMSKYVRKSEFQQYGVCVDGCGIPIKAWEDCDTGHLKSALKLATRFVRENLGLQRKWCNSPYGGAGNAVGFAETVDARYGKGTARKLEKMSQKVQKPFPPKWYREQIRFYQQKLEEL